jgi:peptidoglycan hydrolase CwlO-like protein
MRKAGAILFIFCAMFVFSPAISHGQTLSAEDRARLEKELAKVEEEQRLAEKELANAQNQSASISRDIKVLDAKIKAAQLNIKAKNLLIQTLGNDINSKVKHIGTLETRIKRGHETLGQLMRKTNEVSAYTMPEVLLSQASITGFFQDIDDFEEVQAGLYETFEQIRDDKAETEVEKNTLDKRRNAELDARATIEAEKKNIEANTKEKQVLLAASKDSEKSYATLLAEKKARAAQIRATLFPLAGGGEPIPFGDAYRYALAAQQKTGVRAAFILGIFAQESSLDADATFGKQIGSCYLTDPTTGNGNGANTGSEQKRVMSPTRDVPPFLEITKALGRDPFKTRVSCWQPNYDAGVPFGWGGAMGPAQFIASTWMIVKDDLAAALGIPGMPDPWNPAHAFMAAAMHLRDIGAAGGTYSAERTAACRYYGGGSACTTVTSVYGNSVMIKTDNIQRNMINPLQGL